MPEFQSDLVHDAKSVSESGPHTGGAPRDDRLDMLGPSLISARGLGVRRGGRWLVRNIDLSVRQGEIVTLIGPNGGGKSTTVKAMLGLMTIDEGQTERAASLRVGYVPQKLTIDWTLPLSVRRLMTLTTDQDQQEIESVLDDVGIAHLIDRDVQSLSGGEFQRALLARAILRKPNLLVLDEPVQGVDFGGEIALYELILKLRDQLGCSVLMISHDLHIVMAGTDTVYCLNGHVCCSGTPHMVAASAEYGQMFGPRGAQSLAVYEHHHDHTHGQSGQIVAGGGDE